MVSSTGWQHQVGYQRDWIWRGWRIRYAYNRPRLSSSSIPRYPMIFLHGFGASIGHWRYNLTQLSQSNTVYALDLLGFGGSEKAIAPYTAQLWVEQVYDFWQTFIGEPVILVGNSIGSLISLMVASQYPELAKGLVLISLPDPGLQLEMLPPWAIPVVETVQNIVASPPVLRLFFSLARRPSFIRRWVKLAYDNPNAITDELVEILVTPALERGAARAFCSVFKTMGSPRLGPAVKTLFPQLNAPILLLWGLQDRLIPIQFANPRQYLQYHSNLKLVELENAGHCPHDECPERVNAEILTWLKESFDWG
ncbi:alpha/beta fold hydrolase [Planktothrix sp. FACHB-1365]|uniref:alpha/beta fold hydrolase n=1 Tax=Planktothrix sp. FACHB-1365 TaxID=2692855 RepID=UPI0016828767|nr:alpha/beta fold hydrolase [Planktothrix sp. FACHB-1365]MBD2480543.1 alpha/beta fold hydrolase [Planktothrix sp. FACHB-1365]